MKLFRHDLHSLTGAYALDALEAGAESERFARHLERCSSCASEVRGFREVATGLAFAATATPPPGLRDQVLAAAARTRQLPPEVSSHARPRRARAPRVPWVPWLSGVVATAAVVIAVLFGFSQAHTEQELNQARAQNQAIALVLSSPQVKLLSQATTAGGVATVVLAADTHRLVVTTSGLPALPAGKVYQLWLIGQHKIVSAGLLPSATSGQTAPVLAAGVVSGDKLGLTVEPAPGRPQPTTTPILELPV
ncbi:MAG TPA: anti-sigma factor [Streptosporangiaceae bacterium]|nr:anti-sigma factor [Streptosporangiaceae bacterium]